MLKFYSKKEREIRTFFDVGVILKGIDGILETIGGVLLYFVSRDFIGKIVLILTQHELIEDPKDFFANLITHSFSNFDQYSKIFGSIYLFSHGIIKIILVAGLLKNKLWAYPSAIIVFSLFVFYQMYRLSYSFSIALLALTIFDIIIIGLTWHEYGYILKNKNRSTD